ncbi:MAG: DedA family protein [candidate division Zixibacteria bacterium]
MSLDHILIFVQNQNEFIIYGVIIAASIIENFFPPFPGDSVTVAGAIVAGEGNTSYIGVLMSATIGGLSGAMALYYLGKIKGRKYFTRSKYFGETDLLKVESLFKRFGDFIIILSRFVIGVRSAVSVAAGIGNFEPVRMTVLTAASFVIWNWLLLGAVFYSKANWETISGWGEKYSLTIWTVLLITAMVLTVRWLWKKRNSK